MRADVFEYVYVLMYCYLQRPEVVFPGAGVTDSCHLPHEGAGDQIQVLSKSSKCSYLLITI